ncbi:MAG: DUF2878 family protein [Candidatus Hydrogenedentes bacterium]|nr:DUF2878 family protein [Candidatus Hydrogenedentota bacterium]
MQIMKPDSNRLTAVDAGVIAFVSAAICLAADRLVLMDILVPAALIARMAVLFRLRKAEGVCFRAEAAFFAVCTLLGAYNDWSTVCWRGVYDYNVPHEFAFSTLPMWMLLYWGMILRFMARFARWRALGAPLRLANTVGFGRLRVESGAAKVALILALTFATRFMVFRAYLDPVWSWLPFLIALAVYLVLCPPDRHDVRLMAVVLVAGPLVEILYINVGGLHRYHLGWIGGVPLWIAVWWILVILIWKDIAFRIEAALQEWLPDRP